MSPAWSTPLPMAWKWVRKLKERTASTTIAGASAPTNSSTSGKPLSTKPRQTTPLTTKAMTWLRVRAEMHEPMARNAPAISRLPR